MSPSEHPEALLLHECGRNCRTLLALENVSRLLREHSHMRTFILLVAWSWNLLCHSLESARRHGYAMMVSSLEEVARGKDCLLLCNTTYI